MNILAVDGVPCNSTQTEAAPIPRMSTTQKIALLRSNNEDYEWYPSTPEIIEAVEKDIFKYLQSHRHDYSSRWRGAQDKVRLRDDRDSKKPWLDIETMLDIGAGDGRVLEHFKADKKYGIEIASAQADDLIRRGIFLIGRNFWDVSLVEQNYGLVFCNPPYSEYAAWVNKILYECNFEILYLVIPVRWKNEEKITRELDRYEATVVGGFDFSNADRAARGKVNLVRVNALWKQTEFESKGERSKVKAQATLEDTFERWVRENIADFEEKPNREWEAEREEALALKKTPIDQLVDNYETEKANLGAAFRAIGKLEPEIIKLMGQDKASMLEIIRTAIENLKSKYWRAAFDKLDPVRERMTKRTRDRIFNKIEEFKKMDFNVDNIYSIIIWIINNSNIGILDQIGEVFDAMTVKDYIEKYKSNRHWAKGDWRLNKEDWRLREMPERWKLGLDYRIVLHAYFQSYDKYSIVDDFIIICKNLGFPIVKNCEPDYALHSAAQDFYTDDGELAFTMRYYTGNHNAHLKINKKLLMKFNVEVAKIRKWMSDPDDVVEEYDIPKDEAARLWNSGIALLGSSDVPMLEFKEAI